MQPKLVSAASRNSTNLKASTTRYPRSLNASANVLIFASRSA